jgi:hypothetical protein
LHKKSVLIREVVSLEGGEFIVIVFYYFIASEICPDKEGWLQYFSLICDPFADPVILLHSGDISLFDCHI